MGTLGAYNVRVNQIPGNQMASLIMCFVPLTALKKLRSCVDIEDDIAEMRAEEQAQRAEAKITMFELISSPTLRLPLIIAIVMQLSQQLLPC